ncbi:MAG: hypothetical protein A2W19_01035 [Spirochaetes bacterium RBG_16_49_21]|nr:MAG: hypothetical protein A2W19_01035 [Spirochaetes bacterium RBG_16_49_21]
MATINPYLNFPGNTEEAFNFYKSVFGGEFTIIQRFKDTPEAGKHGFLMNALLPSRDKSPNENFWREGCGDWNEKKSGAMSIFTPAKRLV